MKTTFALLFGILWISFTAAQQNYTPAVEVMGEGIVHVVPDEVTLSVRVEQEGKQVKEVKAQHDKVVNQVLTFLKTMNIPEKDVTTQYIRLNKNYDYNTKTYTYQANQSIQITLRDLTRYESIMNGLIESGINRIDGIAFSSSQKEKLESEARKLAMEDARKKANEYARVLDQSIGKANMISEFQQSNGPQPYLKSTMLMSDSSAASQSVAPGELEIRATVQVRFILN